MQDNSNSNNTGISSGISLKQLAREEFERLNSQEGELLRYREILARREKDFEEYRAKLQEEHIKREQELLREFEERQKLFAEREKKLLDRQKSFERNALQQQTEAEHLRERLRIEIGAREAQLQEALTQLQHEKERYKEESQKRVQSNSQGYVLDALESLDKKERQFHRMSKFWSFVGAGGLAAGLAFFAYLSISTAISLPAVISWPFLVFVAIKGALAVGLVAALAKYSFLFSSYYMQEALKYADRRHAINFGKFYLESYGAAADWPQVKEAFEHWNISASNAFSRSDEALPDISALEKAVSLIERVGKSLPRVPVQTA